LLGSIDRDCDGLRLGALELDEDTDGSRDILGTSLGSIERNGEESSENEVSTGGKLGVFFGFVE